MYANTSLMCHANTNISEKMIHIIQYKKLILSYHTLLHNSEKLREKNTRQLNTI